MAGNNGVTVGRIRARYSGEFKDRMVRKVLRGEATLTSVAAEARVAKGVLSKWVKRARNSLNAAEMGGATLNGSNSASVAELQARIERLEASLETLRRILSESLALRTSLRFPSDT